MWNFLTRRLRPITRKSIHRPLGRLLESVEMLEDRAVPAGLINATFSAGILKIVGDAAANTLTISQTAEGRLTLTTDIGTALYVNGQAVSGFVGHTLAAPVSGNVAINMGDGSDTLMFTGVAEDIDLPSSLSINGGAGNNLITFTLGVIVAGNLTIANGVGLDTTHLYDDVTVLGQLTINNGAGGSLVDADASTDLWVGRTFTVMSGAGFDQLDMTDAQHVMLGGFVQKTGIDFDGSNTDLSPVQSLKITGAVAVANGPGDDVLDIGDATLVTSIAGAVVVANGAGDNHTDIDGTNSLTVGGPIRVTGGIGVDYNHFGLNSTLVTLGSLIVNGGAGDGLNDTKVMGIELNVAGNLTVFGGSGPDSVSINSMQDGMIVGAVTTSLGTGSNVLTANAENGATLMFGKTLIVQSATTAANGNTVELRNVKVQGATFIKTGAGNDFITIDDGIFSGKFTLITAGGADIVNIEQNAGWTEHTQFNSATTILTGAGVDKVYVSGIIAESTRKTIFCSTVKIDGGLDSDTLAMSSLANEFFGLAPVTTGF